MDVRAEARKRGRLGALVLAAVATASPTLSIAATRAVFVGIDTYANSHVRAPDLTPQDHDLEDAVTNPANFKGKHDGFVSDGFVSLLSDDIESGPAPSAPPSKLRSSLLPSPSGAAVCMQLLQREDPHPSQEKTVFLYDGRCHAIVGGVPAKRGETPWMAELQYAPPFRNGFKPTPASTHNCGAALIRADWVITAAHCLADADHIVDTREIPAIRVVRMGSLDLNGPMRRYRITRAIVHPNYCNSANDPATGRPDDLDPDPCPLTTNDIALLRIAPDLNLGVSYPDTVQPIALDGSSTEEEDGAPVKVVGWGASSAANAEAGLAEPKLQIADLKIVNRGDCAGRIAAALRTLHNSPDAPTSYDDGLPPSVVCAGVNDNRIDSCQGDSGGPLIAINADGAARLIGLVSEGPSCAAAPGVYTRISYFRAWINQVMAQMAGPP